MLRRACACVGRLQSPDLGPQPSLGTAWLVRDDLAVTNRHVTATFAERLAGGSAAVTLDLLAELGSDATRPRRVVAVVYEADDHDLAFVRLAPPAAPTPTLALALDHVPGDRVAVIGYPSRNIAHYDPAHVDRMFGDRFDVKRLAPGVLTAVSTTRIDHDCTTLGGNSGSPLVDLADGAVVGVHYGGAGRFVVNHAVPAGLVAERLAGLPR
ncbi:MAG: trypsin-like peptidase domain-containing protein [Myxococcales bacterium]|nr:trypsin-like peptidase domain-containing protein [Myxococcales bacterium]